MNIQKLNPQVSVSGQITATDIEGLASDGVELLVCNRPDGEEPGQPDYEGVASAAEGAGMSVVFMPFAGGPPSVEQVEEFADIVNSGKRVHAYCRTGNRCTIIYGMARALNAER